MSLPSRVITSQTKSPLPNSYWVVPGRLLAGEHPGARSLSDTADRLQALLCAGITMFVDLTEEGETPEYSHLLVYGAGVEPIRYVRHSIFDHDVPDAPEVMQSVLDDIEAHLAHNGTVYVHCRAGIGRTGTAIGCYLVRCGLDGEGALDRLNELWLESERSQTWPRVPETEAQAQYVKSWADADPKIKKSRTTNSAKTEQYAGMTLGMAVGDALGAVAAYQIEKSPQGGVSVSDMAAGDPQSLPRGTWLADTSMFRCLAESLLASKGQNAEDQMQRYLAWQRDGEYSSTGTALNVPGDARKALAQWQWTKKPIAGSHDPNNRDAHALARTAAAVLYFAQDASRTIVEAGESARTTMQAPIALDASRAFAVLLLDALAKIDKDTLLSMKRSDNAQLLRRNRLKLPVTQVMDGWWRGPTPPARNDRDVLAVLGTAMWAFDQTDTFRDGVLLAVNSSANPATVGAVFGAIAGAYYGVNAIPKEWREGVARSAELTDLAHRLADR